MYSVGWVFEEMVGGRSVSHSYGNFVGARGRDGSDVTLIYSGYKSSNRSRMEVTLRQAGVDWLSKNYERALIRRRVESG